MSLGILSEIAASVEVSLERRKRIISLEDLKRLIKKARRPKDFSKALISKTSIIAEVKFRSPSQGELRKSADPVVVASEYLKGGAAALSVLTEENFFNGSLGYLKAIRAEFPESYLLMKDFVIDPYQLLEAVDAGADAVLLIVALLGEKNLENLYRECQNLGLSALVEVHNLEEFETARRLGARLIGVNNRDLKTMKISLETSRQLAALSDGKALLVCESGIENGQQIREMKNLGYSGFLIGTSLMRDAHPGGALSRLIGEVT